MSFTEPITAEQEGGTVVYPHATPYHRTARRRCLGTAGAVSARRFLKPLADPGIMGVSRGGISRRRYCHCSGVASLGMFYMPAFLPF